ncbi:MAG: pyridoxal-phosphate dependent enzyme [archaeon]|nr:pyridoxal-phosphate dependent enzyme [archaeon]
MGETENDFLCKDHLEAAVEECRKYNILLPTYKMLGDPSLVPQKLKEELKKVGMNELSPLNLFRITWFNEPKETGGEYNEVPNYIEIPPQITGIKSKIYMLCGKYFPTGSHKVGASYGPLVTRLTTGKFNPKTHKTMWPSTGNYCRGGVFNSSLMHTPSIAVMPEDVSQERFDWLNKMGADIIKTPPGENNIKEMMDTSERIVKESKGSVHCMNQFVDFSNPIFHYWCTGRAMEKVFRHVAKPGQRFAGIHLTQGSSGTLTGSGEYLRKKFPRLKIAAGEAKQSPTLLNNGFGGHIIEGIGDKHVPWILNVKNLDVIININDEDVVKAMHLFNQPAGKAFLKEKGVPEEFLQKIGLLGKSGIANLIGCIKEAIMFEWNENDIILSVLTDSMDMYQSRLRELKREYTRDDALDAYVKCFQSVAADDCLELCYKEKKRIHNLKYFTWIEQQGKKVDELNAQWYDEDYWTKHLSEEVVDKYDSWIMEFNKKTGLGEKYGM